MTSPPGARLASRLRRAGLKLPEGVSAHRSGAGHHQLRQGAWRWWFEDDGVPLDVGSQYTVTELLHAVGLRVSYDRVIQTISIDVCTDGVDRVDVPESYRIER